MYKEKMERELIQPNLKPGEEMIGFFQGLYSPLQWWYLLLGPWSALGNRIYFVGVTAYGLHLHKLSLWGKPDAYNFFSYSEIAKIKFGKESFFTIPLELSFSNGRKLKIQLYHKGSDKLAKLDEKTRKYLLAKAV